MQPRIAIVTASTVPHPDLDESSLLQALEQRGVEARSVAWDDADVDWSAFSAAVIRSTWNYENAQTDFVAWAYRAARHTQLFNPARVIEWNTNKTYLARLQTLGIPMVPTRFTAPNEIWNPPTGFDEFVVKPNIAGGARDAGRFGRNSIDAAHSLAERIQASGRSVMTQPHMKRVDEDGEQVLIFLGGQFSHAVRRGEILAPDGEYVDTTIGWKTVDQLVPTSEAIALAERALQVLDAGNLLYARVDLVSDDEGQLCVLEVELTEPCLFLNHCGGSVDKLARLIVESIT